MKDLYVDDRRQRSPSFINDNESQSDHSTNGYNLMQNRHHMLTVSTDVDIKRRALSNSRKSAYSKYQMSGGAFGAIPHESLPFIPASETSTRDQDSSNLLEAGPDSNRTGDDSSDRSDNETTGGTRKSILGFPDLGGDGCNVALLLFLYILQGVPLGLSGAVPLILQQNGHVSYKEQALFSLVFWPFSFKLLWAPLIDATYWVRMGWRKSWLVPVQYAIGLVMLGLSINVGGLVARAADHWPSLCLLTAAFFALNFLAATQDIAVDGWALTMLARKNVGMASTCNSIGQTAGYFLGNILFLALESADFCNKYLRSVPSSTGIFTFSDFLKFWGIFFILSTTLVWILKREKPHYPQGMTDSSMRNITDVYKTLWAIIQLPQVKSYAIICLTMKVGFAAADSVTGLKLMDAGVSKEKLAMLAVPLIPLQIIFPLVISKRTNSQRPIDVILTAYPYRLMMGAIFALVVWWTPFVASSDDPPTFSTYYYVVIFLVYAFHQVTLYSMYVAIMAFHARVSDPAVGGTYMTLLNTLSNFGGNWPSTAALWLVEGLGLKRCTELSYASLTFWISCAFSSAIPSANVRSQGGPDTAKTGPNGGNGTAGPGDEPSLLDVPSQVCASCVTFLDGYYVESALCILLGLLWLRWKGKIFSELQTVPLSCWKVASITGHKVNKN